MQFPALTLGVQRLHLEFAVVALNFKHAVALARQSLFDLGKAQNSAVRWSGLSEGWGGDGKRGDGGDCADHMISLISGREKRAVHAPFIADPG